MTLTVIVPTFRRLDRLAHCVEALAAETTPAAQVIFVCRADDTDSIELLTARQATWAQLQIATISRPGVIAAMNAGLAAATGDVIALTDDDAAPWPDWLARIEAHFAADPRLGGVGGRDWQYKGTPLKLDDGHETRAGELQWWGRVIGQHHWAAAGAPREVAVVKGVNCAYRADALRQVGGFDTRLAGTGAQVHWELSLGLAVRRAGWRLVFDPALGVDHFPAERFDEDQRGRFDFLAQRNMVFNETLVLAEHLPAVRRAAFVAWAFVVGTRGAPGPVQVLRLAVQHAPHVVARWRATLRGRWDGLRAARAARRTPSSPAAFAE